MPTAAATSTNDATTTCLYKLPTELLTTLTDTDRSRVSESFSEHACLSNSTICIFTGVSTTGHTLTRGGCVKSQGTLCSDAQSLHTGLHCINVCAECSEHSDCDGDSVYHYYSNSNMQLATGEQHYDMMSGDCMVA